MPDSPYAPPAADLEFVTKPSRPPEVGWLIQISWMLAAILFTVVQLSYTREWQDAGGGPMGGRLVLMAGIQALIAMRSLGQLMVLRLSRIAWTLFGILLSLVLFVNAAREMGSWIVVGILFALASAAAWFFAARPNSGSVAKRWSLALGTMSWTSLWFYGSLLSVTSFLTVEAGLWVRATFGFRGHWILQLLHANDALTGALVGYFMAWAFGTRRALLLIPLPLLISISIAYGALGIPGLSFAQRFLEYFLPAPAGALVGVLLWMVITSRLALRNGSSISS